MEKVLSDFNLLNFKAGFINFQSPHPLTSKPTNGHPAAGQRTHWSARLKVKLTSLYSSNAGREGGINILYTLSQHKVVKSGGEVEGKKNKKPLISSLSVPG